MPGNWYPQYKSLPSCIWKEIVLGSCRQGVSILSLSEIDGNKQVLIGKTVGESIGGLPLEVVLFSDMT